MNESQSPYLVEHPNRVHRYWWTCIPALPADREDRNYHGLKRVWFDHTMNTFKTLPDGTIKPGSRGFYVEGREDHITPIVFQNWALYPDAEWVEPFLRLFGASPIGDVYRAAWCPSYEASFNGGKRIIDVVVSWEDEDGLAAIVIEAKRHRGKLDEKDKDGAGYYLSMPGFASLKRRHFGLLVDERDVTRFRAQLDGDESIATWQELAQLQIDCARDLSLSDELQVLVADLLADQFRYHGIFHDQAHVPHPVMPLATKEGYGTWDRADIPGSVRRFLIGSTVALSARSGNLPEAPFEWLSEEPDALTISRNRVQTTVDRREPRWRLSWRP